MIRLEDVAKDSGFSRATVSRVINDESKVHPETAKLIRASMEKLGYRPNLIARALSSGRNNAVALLLPDVTSFYYTNLIRGAGDAAEDAHYHVITKSISKPNQAEELMNSNLVDGFIIRHSSFSERIDRLLKNCIKKKTPVVFIGKPFNEYTCPSIVVDNVGGARKMAHFFAKNNYRRILFIGGRHDNLDSNDRKFGFRLGLQESGFSLQDLVEVEGDFSRERGYEIARTYLSDRSFDAVFAANDESAMGVLLYLNERSIRIPEEVSVAGFDDTYFAEYLWPPLTTIRQPMYDIGHIAMTQVLKMIGESSPNGNETILPTELIVRRSCKVQ